LRDGAAGGDTGEGFVVAGGEGTGAGLITGANDDLSQLNTHRPTKIFPRPAFATAMDGGRSTPAQSHDPAQSQRRRE